MRKPPALWSGAASRIRSFSKSYPGRACCKRHGEPRYSFPPHRSGNRQYNSSPGSAARHPFSDKGCGPDGLLLVSYRFLPVSLPVHPQRRRRRRDLPAHWRYSQRPHRYLPLRSPSERNCIDQMQCFSLSFFSEDFPSVTFPFS